MTILDAQSGAVVGTVGGKKLDNVNPSLSPDGTKVVFERNASDDSGKTFGIWTAKTDGSHLRQLAKVGQHPLWSPTAGKVAYVAFAGKSVALRLISAGGGKSRALVPRKVENVFGWSPDGKYIAFETGTGTLGKLAVVDVATGKVRSLLQLEYAPTAAWSPDSSELRRQLGAEEPEVLVDLARAGRRLEADPDLELRQLAERPRRPYLVEELRAHSAPVRELVISIPTPGCDHRQHQDPALATAGLDQRLDSALLTSSGTWATSNSTGPRQHVSRSVNSNPFFVLSKLPGCGSPWSSCSAASR